MAIPRDLTEDIRIDQAIDCTKQYLRESKRLREIAALKVSGQTATGRINPSKNARRSLKKARRTSKVNRERDFGKTEGIDSSELSRKKAANECLRCAWPSDRKGHHLVKNCRRQIKLDKGTAGFPKGEHHQEPIESPEGSDPADSSYSEDNID